ncbi:SDR family oxidoreductase [Salinisphaera hydrothermalis]|uniref:Dihydromonapterin reductase n=1 Tax=Salinisphaera hydrothermalis (strain C41B8) TaxID=1304275 RepID=A0A084IRL0_SALHC|nr:SDR family oxidoreductase [Salinisphaera hydrothermalis]KEZ79344.1 dihydrofolate reductase folM [Salinisphaera hydrothermalis C41B8]
MTHPTPDDAPVVVTGANRNVGAHMAHRFLDDGFAVIAQYRTPTEAIDDLAARGAALVQGDFADTDSILAVADAIARHAPRIRALIHNASAFSPTDDDARDAAEQFQTFFEVHMRAPYLLNTRLGERVRAAHGPGDIVHITDIYADNPAPQYDIYCATKAGLQNLSSAFARRLAPDVKVNVIQPGPITFEEWVDAQQQQQMLDATPLGRTGSPDNIYCAVRALLDNDYQTGAVVAVDGGRRLGRQ